MANPFATVKPQAPQQMAAPQMAVPQQMVVPQQMQAPQMAAPQQMQAPQMVAPQQMAAPQQMQVPQMVAPQMAAPQQMVVPQQMQAPQMTAPQQMQAPQQMVAPQMVAPQQMVPQSPGGKLTTKGVPRKTPNRQMTKDERAYVINSYATKTTGQIASELNLTRQQVYRTVHESRTKIKERIEAATASGDIASAEKWQAFITTKLPEKDFGAGGGGRGKGSSIDTVLDSLLDF